MAYQDSPINTLHRVYGLYLGLAYFRASCFQFSRSKCHNCLDHEVYQRRRYPSARYLGLKQSIQDANAVAICPIASFLFSLFCCLYFDLRSHPHRSHLPYCKLSSLVVFFNTIQYIRNRPIKIKLSSICLCSDELFVPDLLLKVQDSCYTDDLRSLVSFIMYPVLANSIFEGDHLSSLCSTYK